jgi:carbon-monoxide dehydrogenase small subunit
VKSCLILAVEADGKVVVTAEGMASQLSDLQRLFIQNGALQCGFCTPSFVLVAHCLLQSNPNPTEREIREYLNGHICRCGTYKQIIQTILDYPKRRR